MDDQTTRLRSPSLSCNRMKRKRLLEYILQPVFLLLGEGSLIMHLAAVYVERCTLPVAFNGIECIPYLDDSHPSQEENQSPK